MTNWRLDSDTFTPRSPDPRCYICELAHTSRPYKNAAGMEEPSPKRHQADAAAKKASFTCQLCSRSYDRADHLARHLDSHRDERTFRCSVCPRGFNRRDLLLRHQATHTNKSGKPKSTSDRSKERAIRACDSCVLSKLRCGNARPCKRCSERHIVCITQTLHRGQSQSEQLEELSTQGPISENTRDLTDTGTGLRTPESGSSRLSNVNAAVDEQTLPQGPLLPAPETQLFLDAISWPATASNGNAFDFPSFFDHIMDPDPNFGLFESSNQVAPDFSNFISETDWYDGSEVIFGSEFTPTLDQAIDTISFGFPESTHADSLNTSNVPPETIETGQYQFPWLWRPGAKQNAFSEENNLPLDERTVDTATSPESRNAPSLPFKDCLTPNKRDAIFHLIIKTAHAHLNIPSFPSANCLDTLLKVGIASKVERNDAWFHPCTFSVEKARPELLIALIATGCCCFNESSIFKTGMMLFEVVHAALSRLFEDDNSVIHDLQYLQASMLWLDAFAFSGYARKMEIAEGQLQPLVTALRRFLKFDKIAYPTINIQPDEEGEALNLKYKQWVEQECYKRLVHHVFKHDMLMTTTKVMNPLVSYAEMTLPLATNKEFWLAPTAEAWKSLYMQNPPKHTISLCGLLANNEFVQCLPASVDHRLANKAYVHGLAALAWEHSQQAKLYSNVDADANGKLWIQSRYQALYDTLRNYHWEPRPHSPSVQILHEFLMMTFHVSAETITSFAGRFGEADARRAFGELQNWVQTKPARLAVWHAAQVLRVAREGRLHRLRGADAFLLHHAIMVLWAWAMLRRDALRKSGIETPAQFTVSVPPNWYEIDNDNVVWLDGESSQRTKAFISSNVGTPFLLLGADLLAVQRGEASGCDLRHPLQVLAGGVRLLNHSFPGDTRERNPLPLDAVLLKQQQLASDKVPRSVNRSIGLA